MVLTLPLETDVLDWKMTLTFDLPIGDMGVKTTSPGVTLKTIDAYRLEFSKPDNEDIDQAQVVIKLEYKFAV